MRLPLVLVLCHGLVLAAADPPVTVRVERMEFLTEYRPLQVGTYQPDRDKPAAWQPLAAEVVVLANGLIEAWVVPAWGARLIRARDPETGVDCFAWWDRVESGLPWTAPGGVKPSFPFFEHGTHLDEPAGHTVVRHPDGAVTVAMDLRFTRHAGEAEMTRHGRYGDEVLNVMVTVRPGSAAVEWRQRKENHHPLPRGDRLWNDAIFPVADPDQGRAATRFLYPMDWVMDRGPTRLQALPPGSARDHEGVSHFALRPRFGFCGVYDGAARVNRLRIFDADPAAGDACGLFTGGRGFCEFWGGVGVVFERPGTLRPAYAPVEFRHRFWIAQGLGEVTYADDELAVAVDGTAFELVASRDRVLTAGEASGPAGPRTVLRGTFDGHRLVVREGDAVLLDRGFPLDCFLPAEGAAPPPGIAAAFAALTAPDPEDLEKECLGVDHGILPTHRRVKEAAAAVTAETPAPRALSLARAAYRWGHLDEAARIAGLFPGPDADLLRGLIAWERGEAVDFGSADWRAGYHRALLAIRAGDPDAALKHLESHLAQVPDAFRVRLAKAYLTRDAALAEALITENPASPEARAVGGELGVEGAAAALADLLRGSPEAATDVAAFLDELATGAWRHRHRYVEPELLPRPVPLPEAR